MAESGYTVCLERVDKALGRVKRIDGLTLYTEPGKIYGLLGPNGAGKTTIFNLITGLYKPDSGRIRVCGLDPVRDYKETRRQIGLLPRARRSIPSSVRGKTSGSTRRCICRRALAASKGG